MLKALFTEEMLSEADCKLKRFIVQFPTATPSSNCLWLSTKILSKMCQQTVQSASIEIVVSMLQISFL